MPPLSDPRVFGIVDRLPVVVLYAPVVVQWVLMALRYRSLHLPLIANPDYHYLPGKSDFLGAAQGPLARAILPWIAVEIDGRDLELQVVAAEEAMTRRGIGYPMVAKPNFGRRGFGVQKLRGREQLASYLASYPVGRRVILQQLSRFEPEAGILWTRMPDAPRGRILSLGLKYSTYVLGDGRRSLGELVEADARARHYSRLFQERLGDRWYSVPASGEPVRLVFAANHSQGAIFRDGSAWISDALAERVDRLMEGLPGFWFGRLDVKFESVETLSAGEPFDVLEINSLGSEPVHMYDPSYPLRRAVGDLMACNRYLWRLGAVHRSRGHRRSLRDLGSSLWRLVRESKHPTAD